ncbi:YdcF family protein [Bacillus glycinifermentans]|uniref:YdcF family protein n=1 Tax=Bacillus glycinifermentans TaxID=1664069 RepID=UPI001FF2C83D|nr:YdcF family protein [Bacillus glycinifermentans]MEC0493286.1 YdcF family protein [Bacillus glycinifermentans]MEC0542584.1 YdcF family protein [Bacillus glycinifermentans]UOY90036.1 YdcF family protein [Bacillus glycinifermentans]
MPLILISCVFLFTGAVILLKERRSFLGGMIFTFGGLSLSITLVLLGMEKISELSDSVSLVVLLIVYGFFPLLFFGICGYFIYNTRMMNTKEGRSATAKLSALLGINLTISVPAFIYLVVMGGNKIPYWLGAILIFILLCDLLFSFFFVCYLFYSWMYQMIPFTKKIDYIIVLGSGIRSEDVPPLLRSRLDKAIEYYHKNPEAKIVVSGGQGADEPVSEAFAMRKYLLSQNIPDEKILLEDQSTTTFENMTFSKNVILQDWQKKNHEPSIIFSTNNYHVLRGGLYARKAGLKAQGVGAPTALYFLPTALIREYIALLVLYKWFSIGIVLFSLFVIVISYLPI